MTRLEEIQGFFAQSIQQPIVVAEQPDALVRTPTYVAGNGRLAPIEQLEIYREQFWLRHVDALEDDFVTIHHLLGHDAFATLAERYLAAYPPTDFSLRDLGARLATFVATDEAYRKDPLLLDCAKLEWAFVDAFDAKDAPPLDPASIAAVPEDAWDGARLILHPSVYRVAMAHPAHEYRAAVRDGGAPERPDARPTHVVVYRGPETLQYIEIEPLAFALLDRLALGAPLATACDEVAADVGEARAAELGEKIGAWFQLWAASGWITAIRV